MKIPSLMRCLLVLADLLLLLTNQGLCWKCPVGEEVCEVWLDVRFALTMMQGRHLVVIKDGFLFPFDATDFSKSGSVSKDEVITGDGWAEPRVVINVNGTVPGPVIEVHAGQRVRVHLRNYLIAESISLHFHGQVQRGTPWMDGVPFVTQCPVLPDQSFTYQFRAEPAGTFWYHSHAGGQTDMGLHGGFVVHPRNGPSNRYDRQFTLLLQGYNHDWDSTIMFYKMKYGMYVNGTKEKRINNSPGTGYSFFRCQSILVNGRGRYHDPLTGLHNEAPLEFFSVRKGKLYRFRLIHSGSVYPLQLSIDSHKLKVVATDGTKLKEPKLADSVFLSPGERYDFELHAIRKAANYWIRIKTLEVEYHTGEAILHYEGAEESTDPATGPRRCTDSKPCVAVNCPFLFFPANQHTVCINAGQLRSAKGLPHDIGVSPDHRMREYFLNFGVPEPATQTAGSVNGIQFRNPVVSALTQPQDMSTRCPDEGYRCAADQVCRCTSVINLQHGQVAQFVFTNLGRGKGRVHPVHMHGHSFWVLKVGYPVYSDTTGRFDRDNMDVHCGGHPDRDLSFCNKATWRDPSWSGNTVPGLELRNPVQKDTINVPAGGYVVVRIKADNPGLWSLQCHGLLYFSDGMSTLMNESFPLHPPPPPGFPKCGTFNVSQPMFYM